MPAPQSASLPAFFTLDNGDTIKISALDPATGNTVTAVIVSNASIAVDTSSATTGPPIPLTPGLLY